MECDCVNADQTKEHVAAIKRVRSRAAEFLLECTEPDSGRSSTMLYAPIIESGVDDPDELWTAVRRLQGFYFRGILPRRIRKYWCAMTPISTAEAHRGEVAARVIEAAEAFVVELEQELLRLESPAKAPVKNADKRQTTKEKLLVISRSGVPYTSKRKLAKKLGCSPTSVLKTIKGNSELSKWMGDSTRRQSVRAEQMTEWDEESLCSPDTRDAIVIPEDREAMLEKVRNYIRTKHPNQAKAIYERLGDNFDDLGDCVDPESVIDTVACSIAEENRECFTDKKQKLRNK